MKCACAILLCGLSVSAYFFYIISYTGRFKKNATEEKMCVLVFATYLSKTFLLLRRIEWDVIKNVYWSSCTVLYPLFLSDINETSVFWKYFRNAFKYQIAWKSVQWEPSCSMRTDGQTWRSKQSFFEIFRTRPKEPFLHKIYFHCKHRILSCYWKYCCN
jgi:hypothetical protein